MASFKVIAFIGVLVALLARWTAHRGNYGDVVNIKKLVADLVQEDDDAKRIAAAVSVMYLANVEHVRQQLRREGALAALISLVLSCDVNHHNQSSELLTAALLGLSKVCAGDPQAQAMAMQGNMLQKLLQVLKSGSASWVAASSQLLYSLHKGSSQHDVQNLVDDNASLLIGLAMELLEGGAYGNSTDAMVSATRLLALLAGRPGAPGHALMKEKDTARLLLQVLAVHHAKNGTAELVGSVAEVLEAMVSEDSSFLPVLEGAGALQHLLLELRTPRVHSVQAVLSLLGLAASTEAGAGQLVAGGILSMCTQLYFHPKAEAPWKQACLDLVYDITDAQRYMDKDQQAASRSIDSSTSAHSVESSRTAHGVHSSRSRSSSSSSDGAHAIDSSSSAHSAGSSSSSSGAHGSAGSSRHLVRALLQVLGARLLPGMHLSALQALRDVADQPVAAHCIVDEGGLKAAVDILSHDLASEGLYPAVWAVQTQRSAVTLLAVLAFHPELRSKMTKAGVIEALVTCMAAYPQGGGLPQQMRITAAAALVPMLEVHTRSKDESGLLQLVQRAVDAGAVEVLVKMLRSSSSSQEKEVAGRVLGLMTRDPALQRMFSDEGLTEEISGVEPAGQV